METIAKATVRSGTIGAPLPDLYPCLARRRVHFRRGTTSMIAGVPGAFKSTLALNLIVGWAKAGMSGLYISADSDAHTVGTRCAAILTGDFTSDVEKTLRKGKYKDPLMKLANVHWEWRGLSVPDIDLRLRAFEQMYGRAPDFVVMDNLMNCVDGPGDWVGQITMTRDLNDLAVDSGTHVLILHHMQDHKPDEKTANQPPPRWEIMGKVTQFPRLILSVSYSSGDRLIQVAPVKNTHGPQDPTGKDFEEFHINTDNCQIEEVESF